MIGVPSWSPSLRMHQANVEKRDGYLAVNIPILSFLIAMGIRYVVLTMTQALTYNIYRLISLLVTTSGRPSMFFSIRMLQTSSLLGCEARPLFLHCYEKLNLTPGVPHSPSFELFLHGGQLTIKHTNAYLNFKERCKCLYLQKMLGPIRRN